MKKHYSVRQLSQLAGVSVRTLHLYDEIGLLKPSLRTEAGYRQYEEKELLRLQQILFYKELDFPLKDIGGILDDPGFDKVKALENHRTALQARKERIDRLLTTIDKTIQHLKKQTMLSHEELYKGLPKEQAADWRKEAADKWGMAAVERSEMRLLTLTPRDLATLKTSFADNWKKLATLMHSDPDSPEVQASVRVHYHQIRQFWGTAGEADPQLKAYQCLGEMYTQDERYTAIDGQPSPAFAQFLCKAITHFVQTS